MELARAFLPDDGFETIPYSGNPIRYLPSADSYLVNEKGTEDREEILKTAMEEGTNLYGREFRETGKEVVPIQEDDKDEYEYYEYYYYKAK